MKFAVHPSEGLTSNYIDVDKKTQEKIDKFMARKLGSTALHI